MLVLLRLVQLPTETEGEGEGGQGDEISIFASSASFRAAHRMKYGRMNAFLTFPLYGPEPDVLRVADVHAHELHGALGDGGRRVAVGEVCAEEGGGAQCSAEHG